MELNAKNELMDKVVNELYPQFFDHLIFLSDEISNQLDSPEVEPILNQIEYLRTKINFIYQKSKLILFPHLKDTKQLHKNIHLLDQLNEELKKVLMKMMSFINILKSTKLDLSTLTLQPDDLYSEVKNIFEQNSNLYLQFKKEVNNG